jgi:hypothetical protein
MPAEGERFARALAAQNPAGLRAVLAGQVDFAALTPGRHWAATDPGQVVDEIILGHWFGADSQITELCSVTTGQVADCQHVAYRLRVRKDRADYLVEQQAFYTAHDGEIDWIRILCSGYRAPTADFPDTGTPTTAADR